MDPDPLATPWRYADLLRECGEILIPRDSGIPGFGEADPDGQALRHLMAEVGARLVPTLEALLACPGTDTAQRVAALAKRKPDRFEHLRDLIVCCYLSTSAVWRRIGYSGRKPNPPTTGEADHWLADGILDSVRNRGRIYTPPPDHDSAHSQGAP